MGLIPAWLHGAGFPAAHCRALRLGPVSVADGRSKVGGEPRRDSAEGADNFFPLAAFEADWGAAQLPYWDLASQTRLGQLAFDMARPPSSCHRSLGSRTVPSAPVEGFDTSPLKGCCAVTGGYRGRTCLFAKAYARRVRCLTQISVTMT